MSSWLRREKTKRWLEPLVYVVAIACSVAAAAVLGSDDPVSAVLVIPIAIALLGGLARSLARRPKLSLSAECGDNGTRSSVRGLMAYSVVYLFLRNEEGAGEARHCKVVISDVTPLRGFHLDGPGSPTATEHYLDFDTHTITWQPLPIPPGGVVELQLKSDYFHVSESAHEPVRVTAHRIEPIEATLVLRVTRHYDVLVDLSVSVEPGQLPANK